VTEDGGWGATIRRREQYFTFDVEVYRAWSGGASVWLDNDPDDGSSAAYVQQLLPTIYPPERGGFRKRRSGS
jgi:hypothetical protein